MTREQHITQATRHILAATFGRQEISADEPKGAPLVEFDSYGQQLWNDLDMMVRIEQEKMEE